MENEKEQREREEGPLTVVWWFCLSFFSFFPPTANQWVLARQGTRVRKTQCLPSGGHRLWGPQIHSQVWIKAVDEALTTVTEMSTGWGGEGEKETKSPGVSCRGRGCWPGADTQLESGRLAGHEGGMVPGRSEDPCLELPWTERSSSLPVSVLPSRVCCSAGKFMRTGLFSGVLAPSLHVLIGTREAVSANVFVP